MTAAHDLALVAKVSEAQRAGLTWAQIATAIGEPNGKAAKKAAHKAARRAQAELLRQDGRRDSLRARTEYAPHP